MSYKVTYSNEYLSHHGILGQKWGKRNGPPYPLDAGDHSSSEKKAGWQKSVDRYRVKAKSHRDTAEILKKHGYDKESIDVSEAMAQHYENKANKIQSRHENSSKLTADQKEKLIKAAKIGAVAVGTALAAYGTYRVLKNGTINISAMKDVSKPRLNIDGVSKSVFADGKIQYDIFTSSGKTYTKTFFNDLKDIGILDTAYQDFEQMIFGSSKGANI